MKNKIEKSIQKTIVYNDDLGHTVEVITPIVGNSDVGVLGTLSHLVDDILIAMSKPVTNNNVHIRH